MIQKKIVIISLTGKRVILGNYVSYLSSPFPYSCLATLCQSCLIFYVQSQQIYIAWLINICCIDRWMDGWMDGLMDAGWTNAHTTRKNLNDINLRTLKLTQQNTMNKTDENFILLCINFT